MNCTTELQARSLDDQNLMVGYAKGLFFRELIRKYKFCDLYFMRKKRIALIFHI